MSEALSIQITQFKAEMAKMMAMFNAIDARMTALEARYGITTPQTTQLATQQSTPPAPQEAKKEEANVEETRPQLLYQATVEDAEDDAEKDAEKETHHQYGSSKLSSNKPGSKTTVSTIPRPPCTTRASKDSAACLTIALLLAYRHTTFLASQFSYIECKEDMEATGQG